MLLWLSGSETLGPGSLKNLESRQRRNKSGGFYNSDRQSGRVCPHSVIYTSTSCGQFWPVILCSQLGGEVSMNYPAASQRERDPRSAGQEAVTDAVRWIEEESGRGHGPFHTSHRGDCRRAWHGPPGCVSANKQMQMCPPRRSWGRGEGRGARRRTPNRGRFDSARSKWYQTPPVVPHRGQMRNKEIIQELLRGRGVCYGLWDVLDFLRRRASMHISHTLTTVRDTGRGGWQQNHMSQASVWAAAWGLVWDSSEDNKS